MEDTYLVEQDNSYPATFTLADLSAQFLEECFDILPLDTCTCTCRVSKDQFERALVLSLHVKMVPPSGTIARWRALSDAQYRCSTERMVSRTDEASSDHFAIRRALAKTALSS